MLLVLEILVVLFSTIVLINTLKRKKNIHTIIPIIIIFYFVMVVPLILEILIGPPKAYYHYYKVALADEQTLYIYLLFVALSQLAFSFELHRIKKRDSKYDNYDISSILSIFQNFKYKNLLKFICIVVLALTVIAVFLSPNPSYYLHINTVHDTISMDMLQYKNNIMDNLCILLFLSVILLKLVDKDNKIFDIILRIIFIIVIAFINQKRTLLLMIVGVFFVVDKLRSKNKKHFIIKYIVVIGLMAFYFYYYTILTDKISYNSDWYYLLNEYLFRSMHTRFAIYSSMHQDVVHILDYPGQSIIFSILFFIPREIWPLKPYPYIDYYMKGLLNYKSLSLVTYHMPASYYPEFISNFGIIGIIIAIAFTIWYSRFFDKQNGLNKFLGIILISLLQIYYYDDMLKLLAIIIFVLIIKNKIKKKNI